MYAVAMVCSKRFKKEERAFAKGLRKLGITVYEPALSVTPRWNDFSEEDKLAHAAGLTYRHFQKIRKSDAIFVLNKDGYAGVSTNMEIGYAAALDKRIYFFEEDTDYPRKILVDGIAKTPKELVERIKNVAPPDILD